MNFSSLFSKSKNKQSDVNELKLALRKALTAIQTPHFPNGIYGQIAISVEGNSINVELPFNGIKVEQEITEGLKQILAFEQKLTFSYSATQPISTKVNNVKMVIAVASGKGGVGKSTVTCNLAAALAKLGHKVGVVDADIYGPSMPLMFGLQGKNVSSSDGKTMIPLEQFDVTVNSIGFLVPEDKAAIWRGPMASKALLQVLNETNWPELDVLLVDMPPGTGDIQLTMSETVKCDGAIIVTTPQTVALADADKGINMFQKVATPILGLVENMSHFSCDNCGKVHHLFGDSGGVECAERHNIPLLGQLPLELAVRQGADQGQPFALNGNIQYQQLAFSLMMQLSKNTNSIISLG